MLEQSVAGMPYGGRQEALVVPCVRTTIMSCHCTMGSVLVAAEIF